MLAQKCQHSPLGSPGVEVSRETTSQLSPSVERDTEFSCPSNNLGRHMVTRHRHHLQCIASDDCDGAVRSLDPMFLFVSPWPIWPAAAPHPWSLISNLSHPTFQPPAPLPSCPTASILRLLLSPTGATSRLLTTALQLHPLLLLVLGLRY